MTKDTILEFDFRSDHEGEIHGIGFDSDAGLSSDRTFMLHGTQNWGITAHNDYDGDGEWKHYRIHVGEHFTGEFNRLTFANDHDVANPNGDSFFANVRVYEPTGHDISYEWRQVSGPKVDLNDTGAPDPNFTAPDLLTNSKVTFEVSVSEGGETVTDTVTVTINADDDAPTAEAGDDLLVAEGDTVRLSGSGTDPEGQGLTYEWVQVGGPKVALDDAHAAQPTFTAPDTAEDSELVFELRVSDGAHTSVDTVTVDVREMMNIDAGEDQVVDEGDTVTLSAGAQTRAMVDAVSFDADEIETYGGTSQDTSLDVSVEGDGNTLHLEGNGWKSIDHPYTVTEDTILEFDFRSDHEGEIHGIGFDNDAALSADRTFMVHGTQTWGITAHNDYEGDGQWKHYQIRVGDHFTGDFGRLTFANDHDVGNPDGDSFFRNVRVYEAGQQAEPAEPTFAWRQVGGPTVALSDASSATPTFDTPDVQEPTTLTFEVEVSDGTRVRTDTVDITVNPVNHGPIADAGADLAVAENEFVTLNGTNSRDPDVEDTLTYEWVQTSGPKVTLSDPASANPTFAAPEQLSNTDLTFELRVSDGESTSVDTVTVTVNADNDVPTADAGLDQIVDEHDLVQLGGSGTDPEGQELTYQWVQTSGPKVMLSDPTSANPTFEAPERLSNTDITFELRVSDGENTSVDTVTVTVEAEEGDKTAAPRWDGTEKLRVLDPMANIAGGVDIRQESYLPVPDLPGDTPADRPSQERLPIGASFVPDAQGIDSDAPDVSGEPFILPRELGDKSFDDVFELEEEFTTEVQSSLGSDSPSVVVDTDQPRAPAGVPDAPSAAPEQLVDGGSPDEESESDTQPRERDRSLWAMMWGMLRGKAGADRTADESAVEAARQVERQRRK